MIWRIESAKGWRTKNIKLNQTEPPRWFQHLGRHYLWFFLVRFELVRLVGQYGTIQFFVCCLFNNQNALNKLSLSLFVCWILTCKHRKLSDLCLKEIFACPPMGRPLEHITTGHHPSKQQRTIHTDNTRTLGSSKDQRIQNSSKDPTQQRTLKTNRVWVNMMDWTWVFFEGGGQLIWDRSIVVGGRSDAWINGWQSWWRRWWWCPCPNGTNTHILLTQTHTLMSLWAHFKWTPQTRSSIVTDSEEMLLMLPVREWELLVSLVVLAGGNFPKEYVSRSSFFLFELDSFQTQSSKSVRNVSLLDGRKCICIWTFWMIWMNSFIEKEEGSKEKQFSMFTLNLNETRLNFLEWTFCPWTHERVCNERERKNQFVDN